VDYGGKGVGNGVRMFGLVFGEWNGYGEISAVTAVYGNEGEGEKLGGRVDLRWSRSVR
jgi:hypothetical protein